MNFKKTSIFVLCFLSLLFSLVAQEQRPVETLYVIDSGDTLQVAFGFNYELIESGSKFYIQTFLNDELLLDESCTQVFDSIEGIYGKVTCPIEIQGDGNYNFVGILEYEDSIVYVSNQKFSQYEGITSTFSFKEVDEGTLITLFIEGEGEHVRVLSDIPGEVISYLDEENKDQYIISDLPFEILESNPLIAWNVEKIPTEINYTIKKNISQQERNDFGVEIRESEGTHYLTYIIFVLFLVVLFFIFKPAFKKK